jgi:hypothetical protein
MEEPEHEWPTLHNASELAQSFEAPPVYVDVPAPAYDDQMLPDFALSPNTLDTLEHFLAMQPNISLVNGKYVMNYDAVNDNNLWQGTIDPSLINEKVTKPSDDDDNDDAPLCEVIQDQSRRPTININNWDISDPVSATLAALSDEELLAKVLNDSSDEEEECLTYDMVKYHLWVGFNIRYMLVPNHNDYIYLTIYQSLSVRTPERTLRLTAEQLQERFAGTREALWKYWQTKHKGRIPTSKIRRHLKKMGISGFFREMLWHLLSEEEYHELMRLRKQGALHLWQW